MARQYFSLSDNEESDKRKYCLLIAKAIDMYKSTLDI